MFYETARNDHGLPHNPFKAIVAPRPIGWISSLDADGRVNLAPYSYFNAVAGAPPMVMFSSDGIKDSVSNIEATGEFVCNLVAFEFFERMSLTSAPLPPGEDEMAHAGLEAEPSRLVRPPRVKGVPAALECRKTQVVRLVDIDGKPVHNHVVVGQVIGVYIDDRFIREGRFDTGLARPVSRLGYQDYSAVERVFSLARPAGGGDVPAR
jgi:flavin reductase (DIM6/NTAB) family NADH-FMN oxidoreductase RutF